MKAESEVCPKRKDGTHCNCWFDGGACCACGAPAMTDEQKREQGMTLHEEFRDP